MKESLETLRFVCNPLSVYFINWYVDFILMFIFCSASAWYTVCNSELVVKPTSSTCANGLVFSCIKLIKWTQALFWFWKSRLTVLFKGFLLFSFHSFWIHSWICCANVGAEAFCFCSLISQRHLVLITTCSSVKDYWTLTWMWCFTFLQLVN